MKKYARRKMQVQQRNNMNNKPSFGNLIVPREEIMKMMKNGHLYEFKKALPELKEMAIKNNIEIRTSCLDYCAIASPKKSFFGKIAELFMPITSSVVKGESFLRAITVRRQRVELLEALPLKAEDFVKLGKEASDNLVQELEKTKIAEGVKL